MKTKLKNIAKPLVAICLPLIIIGVALFLYQSKPVENSLVIDGTIESVASPHYSQVGGSLLSAPLRLGQAVKEGTLLVQLDTKPVLDQIAQLEALLRIKEVGLDQIQERQSTAAIDAAKNIAKNNVVAAQKAKEQAEEALEKAQKELETQQSLFDSGIVAATAVQSAQNTVLAAEQAVALGETALANARQTVDTIVYPPEEKDNAAAILADMDYTRLQIQQLNDSLADYEIRALHDGILVDYPFVEGSVVPTGSKLAEVSREQEKYFVFYMPQEQIHLLEYGSEILVSLRSKSQAAAGEAYTAQVVYMDYKAQYAPKEEASPGNKNKLSLKIKARFLESGKVSIADVGSVTFLLSQ